MSAANLSDEVLLAFLQSHPGFRDIVGAVGNLDGDLGQADAAEERLVEEMRLLGRAALQGWADERVVATERDVRGQTGMHRQGKKTLLAHEIRRYQDHRAAIQAQNQPVRPLSWARRSVLAGAHGRCSGRSRILRRTLPSPRSS